MVSSVTFDRFEQAHMHANRVKSCGQCHSKKKQRNFQCSIALVVTLKLCHIPINVTAFAEYWRQFLYYYYYYYQIINSCYYSVGC